MGKILNLCNFCIFVFSVYTYYESNHSLLHMNALLCFRNVSYFPYFQY